MYETARNAMVCEQLIARGISNGKVVQAMRGVPRHLFVPQKLVSEAYEDHPVHIGAGQTISQPYVVALMLELSEPSKKKKLLEVGSGCGYLLALASLLFAKVVGVERIEELYRKSVETLTTLSVPNTTVIWGDGSEGVLSESPFDAIIVSCSCEAPPKPLLEQLAPGGILVVPVGDSLFQELLTVHRTPEGYDYTSHGGVRFVPLLPGRDQQI